MKLQSGDFVIVKKYKASTHPSPRAKDVNPASSGETYSYRIDKFWKVVQVLDDDTIEIETRRGKRHQFDPRSLSFRKATLLDRWLHGARFF